MYSSVLPPETLLAHLADPTWLVFDCRFDLKDPAWGFRNYQVSHIPGAGYAHLDRDLSGPVEPGKTGRHPLPDVAEIAARFGEWGIHEGAQVVVYDTSGGAYAARMWWLLHFLGHEAAAVLDGGFQAWESLGCPLSAGVEARDPAHFTPRPRWEMVAKTEDVEKAQAGSETVLIDARAPERFRGEVEPIDPVAGRIPGAVNRFHGANLQPDGRFLPPEALRGQFEDLLGSKPAGDAIVYCGSGVTSCHHLVALARAGLPGARLYVGSWSEWITDPGRKVERGPGVEEI